MFLKTNITGNIFIHYFPKSKCFFQFSSDFSPFDVSCQKRVHCFKKKIRMIDLHKLYNFCKIFGVWGSSSCISLGSLTQTQFAHGFRANLQSVRDCNFIFDTLERSCLHYSLVVGGWVGTNDSWTTKHKFSVGLCHHHHQHSATYNGSPLCYIRRQCSWWWCAYPASLFCACAPFAFSKDSRGYYTE